MAHACHVIRNAKLARVTTPRFACLVIQTPQPTRTWTAQLAPAPANSGTSRIKTPQLAISARIRARVAWDCPPSVCHVIMAHTTSAISVYRIAPLGIPLWDSSNQVGFVTGAIQIAWSARDQLIIARNAQPISS